MLPCNVTIGAWQDFQGFRCNSKCVSVFQWCQPEHVGYWPDDVGSSCPELEGLRTTYSQVCHNPKFWVAVPCGQGRAQQCTARYSGQCTGKVTHVDGYTWTLAKCQDKRDLTRHSDGKQCKENEFTCVKEGKVQCLDNQLRCDEMLACDKGEDEENCHEEYKRRKYIHDKSRLACTSPFFYGQDNRTPATIFRKKCNNLKECHMGSHEVGCQVPTKDWFGIGKN